uniref:Uncharacterized protein n=1 Tax=Haptolina brevifila TaxID=156173 RepID=A0A7S2JKQ3_9EUKA|mmetsp:Transcript_83835/g.167355  ORF Transcript_83835/g.167355 Transcript_83835/m.167355 type:complete len:174 (+) Transcript_83835:25-546(+)
MMLCALLLLIGSASASFTSTEEEVSALQTSARVTKGNCKNIAAILSGKAKPEPFPLGGLTGIAAVSRLRRVPRLSEANCKHSFYYVPPVTDYYKAPLCETNTLLAGLSTLSQACQTTLASALPPTNAALDYITQTCPCYKEISDSTAATVDCRARASDLTTVKYDIADCKANH